VTGSASGLLLGSRPLRLAGQARIVCAEDYRIDPAGLTRYSIRMLSPRVAL
jgi:hypothetical protein